MTTLLQINSSIQLQGSNSTKLADQFVDTYICNRPDTQLVKRDLGVQAMPHLDAEIFGAFISPPEQRDAAQQAHVDLSDQLIAEIKQADAIVLGLPMYNFGIPSTLKAYFDHIARSGETFKYTENGPVGLVEDKPVYVIAARGGIYAGTDKDTQSKFIQDFFAFIGITQVKFIYAEGLAMGEESARQAMTEATQQIQQAAA